MAEAYKPVSIPALPVSTDPALRQFLSSIKEALEVRVNQRGNALDAAPTFRDLLDAGIITLKDGVSIGGKTYSANQLLGLIESSIPDWVTSDTEPPPPTGLQVIPGASTVQLYWDQSTFDQYANTEVWAADSNNLSLAQRIGSNSGNSYLDALASAGIQRYYWIRHIAKNGLAGSFNAVSGDGVLDGPSDPVVTYAFSGPDAVLTWPTPTSALTIQYYRVERLIASTWTFVTYAGGNNYRTRAEWAGARQYRITAIDVRDNESAAGLVTVTVVVPGVVTSTSATFSGANSIVAWDSPVTGSLPVVSYRVYDTTQQPSSLIVESAATAYTRAVAWSSKNFIVTAIDTAGNEGSPATIASTVIAPTVVGNTPAATGSSFKLSWVGTQGSIPITGYEIRHGVSFAAGTPVGELRGDTITVLAAWLGERDYWVVATDVAGNPSAAANMSATVVAASAPAMTSEVVDNNVLFRWTCVAGTMPIDTFQLRKGATWAGATVIGDKSGGFTTVFETVAGTYTYWLAARDTAGNYGPAASVTTTVQQPPDYVLAQSWDSTFSGTKGNALLDAGVLTLPVDTAETFEAHFNRNLVTAPEDFSNAAWLFDATSTVTVNATTAPNATLTADKIVEAATTGGHYRYQSIARSAGVYTFSVYVKQVDRQWAAIQLATDTRTKRFTVLIDLSTGAFVSSNSLGSPVSPSYSIFDAGSGWWRVTVTATHTSGSVTGTVGPSNSATPSWGAYAFPSYTGDITKGIYAWGAQLENRAYASTYLSGTTAWASPDAQVAAGYPIFIQPGTTTGYYEEVFDYGATLAAMKVSVSFLLSSIAGTVNSSVSITTALDSGFTTGVSNFTGTQAFATNFRYVKVRVTATATDDKGIATLSGLNVVLDAKLKNFSGTVSALAADAGGTTVYLTDDRTSTGNKLFVDVDALALTPLGTTALISIYDFVDAANPLSFKVLVFNTSGVRQNATVSYTVRGY